MMKITLYTEPIFTEVRQKSHLEVQSIKDAEDRDNARAGVEKTDEIIRCIIDAVGQLERRCLRFLDETLASETDDIGGLPQYYSFEFNLSERRMVSKADPLTAAMHAFVAQYALAKFCATVNQTEMSNKHSLAALDYGNQIDEMLYTKQPPRV